MRHVKLLLGVSLLTFGPYGLANAQPSGEIQVLKQQVEQLLKRIDALEKESEQSKNDKSEKNHSDQTMGDPYLKPPVVNSGGDKVSLKISGRINRAALFVDDGKRARVKHVDNSNSSSRLTFDATAKLNSDVSVGARYEAGINENASSKIAMGEEFSSTDRNNFSNRHLFIYAESKTLGKLSCGHTNEASKDVMEDTDLSGTSLIVAGGTFAEIVCDHRFFNTTLDRRNVDGGIRVDHVVDGFNGSRRDVIRYDTPKFFGFQAAASHSGRSNDSNAFALRYQGKIKGTKISAAAGYTNAKTHTVDTAQVGQVTTGFKQYNASVGILHSSGLNFYLSGGRRKHDSADIKNGSMWATKLGYQKDILDCGKTAISIQYGEFKDLLAARVAPRDKFRAKAFGVGFVQKFDSISTEFYIGLTRYLLDANTIEVNNAEVSAEYKGITALFSGARIKF